MKYQVQTYQGNYVNYLGDLPKFSSYRKARKFITNEIKLERGKLFTVIVDKFTIETHLGNRQGYHQGPSYFIKGLN
jgi:hypothetical protein